MSEHAEMTAQIDSWDESTYEELDGGRKLTRATVTQTYSGDLDGQGVVEHLMCYGSDGSATYISQERIAGTLAGRRGTFVAQGEGTYEGDEARWRWQVVAGSGTGELEGLRGEGTAVARHDGKPALTLDFDLG